MRSLTDISVLDKQPAIADCGLHLGLDKLCQHNFENNWYSQEYENNAGIIGKAFCVRATNSIVVFQTTRTLIRRLCFTLYHASVQQKALIFQTTRTLIRRLCFTLYHASVQQKALIFVSQNMIVLLCIMWNSWE